MQRLHVGPYPCTLGGLPGTTGVSLSISPEAPRPELVRRERDLGIFPGVTHLLVIRLVTSGKESSRSILSLWSRKYSPFQFTAKIS